MRANPSATFAILNLPEPTWSSNKRQQNILRSEIDGSRTWWTNAKRLPWISTPRHLYPCNALKPTPSQIHPLKMLSSLPISSQRSVPHLLHRWLSNSPIGDPYPLPEEHPMFDFPLIMEHMLVHACAVSADCLRPRVRVYTVQCTTFTPSSSWSRPSVGPAICASLTYGNLSIQTDTFSNEWKTVVVTPVFKNRIKTENPSNYRLISLLHAVGKILDHTNDIQSRAHIWILGRQEHSYGTPVWLPPRTLDYSTTPIHHRLLADSIEW